MKRLVSVLSVIAVLLSAVFIPAAAADYIPGDVNGSGEVLADDARLALRASARLQTLDSRRQKAADVDLDGRVLAADARQILRYSARLQTVFYPADRDSYALYEQTIRDYGATRVERAAGYGYDIDVPTYGYSIKDINSDGTDELVILEKGLLGYEREPYIFIGAIYTLDGTVPVSLYFTARHGGVSVTSDGYVVFIYKGANIQRIVGAELVSVAYYNIYTSPIDGDVDDFLRANGVSTEEMTFDYIPFNG